MEIFLNGPRVKIGVKDSDLKKKVANHVNDLLFSKGGGEESLVANAPVSSLVEEAKIIFDKIRRDHGKLPIDVDPYMKRMFGTGMAIFFGHIGQVVEMQLNNLNPELLRLTPEESVEEMRRMAQEYGDKIQVVDTDNDDKDKAVETAVQKLVDDMEEDKKRQN